MTPLRASDWMAVSRKGRGEPYGSMSTQWRPCSSTVFLRSPRCAINSPSPCSGGNSSWHLMAQSSATGSMSLIVALIRPAISTGSSFSQRRARKPEADKPSSAYTVLSPSRPVSIACCIRSTLRVRLPAIAGLWKIAPSPFAAGPEPASAGSTASLHSVRPSRCSTPGQPSGSRDSMLVREAYCTRY